MLHWINPLVWLAAYLSREDAELACDSRVTGHLPDMERLAYAHALAGAAGRCCTGGNRLMLSGKWLKQRINGVLHNDKARKWGAKTSIMPPRTANCPTPSTRSTRLYPAAVRRFENSVGSKMLSPSR